MSSIVSVKQTGEPVVTQLGSADEALIIETVEAEIQLARLALIRGNDELFRQSLARVDDQLEAFFDTDAAAVNAAQNDTGRTAGPGIAGAPAGCIRVTGADARHDARPGRRTGPAICRNRATVPPEPLLTVALPNNRPGLHLQKTAGTDKAAPADADVSGSGPAPRPTADVSATPPASGKAAVPPPPADAAVEGQRAGTA